MTEVIDELEVEAPVTIQLNDLFELEPIQFATGSAEILPESFPTLDAAAEILSEADPGQLEVQGYTDVRGSTADNLELSQSRGRGSRDLLG